MREKVKKWEKTCKSRGRKHRENGERERMVAGAFVSYLQNPEWHPPGHVVCQHQGHLLVHPVVASCHLSSLLLPIVTCTRSWNSMSKFNMWFFSLGIETQIPSCYFLHHPTISSSRKQYRNWILKQSTHRLRSPPESMLTFFCWSGPLKLNQEQYARAFTFRSPFLLSPPKKKTILLNRKIIFCNMRKRQRMVPKKTPFDSSQIFCNRQTKWRKKKNPHNDVYVLSSESHRAQSPQDHQ